MPRKARTCIQCDSKAKPGEKLCPRCLEIRLTPCMMLDQCPCCKKVLLIGEHCNCWRCRCGVLNPYGQGCSGCHSSQPVH
jgi:hypothetical protein